MVPRFALHHSLKGRSLVIKVSGFYEARKKERQSTHKTEQIPTSVVVLDPKKPLKVVV